MDIVPHKNLGFMTKPALVSITNKYSATTGFVNNFGGVI